MGTDSGWGYSEILSLLCAVVLGQSRGSELGSELWGEVAWSGASFCLLAE